VGITGDHIDTLDKADRRLRAGERDVIIVDSPHDIGVVIGIKPMIEITVRKRELYAALLAEATERDKDKKPRSCQGIFWDSIVYTPSVANS